METINYAREAGYLAGAFRFIAHDLVRQGLISYEHAPKVEEMVNKIITEAREKSKEN